MDLTHPMDKFEVADVLAMATADRHRILVVGGRTHADKGNPCDVDAELWTTQLDGLVSYEPAEMIVVAEAGMRVGELDRILAEGGQEWPCDAPPEATVGGVIAAAANSPRRLKVGPVRDSVIEREVVTGDGRLVKSGARTVKSVTGYDVHKLMTGSLGTLGVIVQVALKVRPRPLARRTVRIPGGLETALRVLEAVPNPAAVLATPQVVELRLEGWPEEVDGQTEAARSVAGTLDVADDGPFPVARPWEERPVVAEAAVAPSRLRELLGPPLDRWGALVGVGLAWIGLGSPEISPDGELDRLRARAGVLGGIAPVIKGPGGLGEDSPPGLHIHRRLKAAFDPAGVLAPGRFWGGI
ncbi:MAG TPA: FAD-binding protein [Methylomirabilota bacterium]|nr:FAD-binding protein [Methylomirabilota bacterium]